MTFFAAAFHRLHTIWVFHEKSDGISWLILFWSLHNDMQVKRLYDDGLVDDIKKKLGLTQWKIFFK